MKPSDIIAGMMKILSSADKWTQRAYARNKKGETCPPNDPSAVCFCLLGALHAVLRWEPASERVRVLEYLKSAAHVSGRRVSGRRRSLHKWQDEPQRTFLEITECLLAAYHTAVAKGE